MSWQVTKNAAELCVLLIREMYGQLPSRIFEILISQGRSTIQQLARISSTSLRHVRHGLAVLIQQNLVYHYTDSDTSRTIYEANHYHAYNIVRNGKILDCVHRNYGETAKRIVHLVMASGHIKVSSLVHTYLKNHGKLAADVNGSADLSNGHSNGDPFDITGDDAQISGYQVLDDVAHLIAIGILEPLSPKMLQSPEDIRSEVDKDLMKAYPSGLRGKQKGEHDDRVRNAVRDIRNKSKSLKLLLEHKYLYGSGAKRRKVANGDGNHGPMSGNDDNILEDTHIVRVNYEKCLVELRNQRLCQFVDDTIGYTTAQVYGALLAALSKKLACCQPESQGESFDPMNPPSVTTIEIFEYLKTSVDVFGGIGKPSADQIDVTSAEKIERDPPSGEGEYDGYGAERGAQASIEESDNDGDMDMETTNGYHLNGNRGGNDGEVSGQNGDRDTKVTFADKGPTKAERMQRMRQHLLILAESGLQFVRHCGTRDQGEWTVDFEVLFRRLRFLELDTIIEDAFGREGLRLIKILRAKGKIDDKTLPTMALMQRGDVHMKMVEMELAGFLDVQEVPRDNNRVAARTLFLWFFDEHRTLTRVLDNTYKAMVRHLQRLEVESQKKKNILSLVERTDVQGMEEEKLNGDAFNEYQQFLDIQGRLLGQVHKLDDLVSVLRDY